MIGFAPAPQKKMLVVLSGGLDSATALGLTVLNAEKVSTLTFRYGQRHIREVDAADDLIGHYNIQEHYFFDTPDLAVLHRPFDYQGGPEPLLPKTWKPGRNMIFLAYAYSLAYSIGATVVVTGIHEADYPGYPDCHLDFLQLMHEAAKVALATPLMRWTPFIRATKTEIVKLGLELKVPYEKTWSCYVGGETPCRKCDACVRRERAFVANGTVDPLLKELP